MLCLELGAEALTEAGLRLGHSEVDNVRDRTEAQAKQRVTRISLNIQPPRSTRLRRGPWFGVVAIPRMPTFAALIALSGSSEPQTARSRPEQVVLEVASGGRGGSPEMEMGLGTGVGRVGGGTHDDGVGDVIAGEWAKRPSETLNESEGAWCGARS